MWLMEEYNRRKLVWKGNLQNKCQKIRFYLVCLSHRVQVLGFGRAKNETRAKND